ncbi:hypothetical protein [Kitasatospora sp. NBC_01539]|uniref:hypothetical protein n=1 Tax=Kitasatospora sp. NBC_01539 TaxID=2903577 RepID=UPI0038601B03
MTAPNTPTGPDAHPPVPHDPFAPPPLPARPDRPQRALLPELRAGGLTAAACALLGVVLGLLWLWLAPRVGLIVKGDQLLYADPEGEQRAGADSVFALLALGAGLLTALAAFLLTRRRGGGIAVAVGLAVGGLAGSVAGWQLGMRLGPTSDLVAHARAAGEGGHFSAPLELGAHGALLVWPMTSMVLLLALSAAFGKREEDPPPYWASPQPWAGPVPQDAPQQPGLPPGTHPDAPVHGAQPWDGRPYGDPGPYPGEPRPDGHRPDGRWPGA